MILRLEGEARAARPSGALRGCRSRRDPAARSHAECWAGPAARSDSSAWIASSSTSSAASRWREATPRARSAPPRPGLAPWPGPSPWRWRCAPRAGHRPRSARPCAAPRAPRSCSTSRTKPRRASSAATLGRSLRNSLGSSTGYRSSRISSQLVVRGPRAPRRERLADLDLQTARRRHVVAPLRHAFGQIALAGRIRVGLIVRVAVALAVAELLHQPRRRVAQVQRHLERAELGGILHGCAERGVDRVALRRAGHEHDRLRERELALRDCPSRSYTAQASKAQRERARIGEADVLARHAHGAPRDVDADRSRRRACGTASTARRRDRCRAPTCAAPRSDRRNSPRPCRSARRCRRSTARMRIDGEAVPLAPPAGEIGRSLEQVQHAPRIAVRGGEQQLARARRRARARSAPSPRSGSRERAVEEARRDPPAVERLQHVDPRARRAARCSPRTTGSRWSRRRRSACRPRHRAGRYPAATC